MATITDKAIGLELTPKDKIRFVVTVLPILSALGAVLRVTGRSEEAVLIVVVPLLIVAFFGWRFAIVMKDAQHGREGSETQPRETRDGQLSLRSEGAIEARQTQLREIRLRQRAEQEHLIREHASADQLARMMERHRSEYEALLSRRTA